MDTANQIPVPAPFNLADFEASDTAFLEVQNKKGDGPLKLNGQLVRIEVFGPGSRESLSAQHKQEQASQAAAFAAARGKPIPESIDDRIKRSATNLAAVTRSIENLPLTPIDLYTNPKLGYITAQVARFKDDWANF